MASKADHQDKDNMDCDQEAKELLSSRQPESELQKLKSDARTAKQIIRLLGLCLFIVCFLAIILSTLLTGETPVSILRSNGQFFDQTNAFAIDSDEMAPGDEREYPQLMCLVGVREALNANAASFDGAYTNVSEHIIESNITDFIENFRSEEFDSWGKTFEEVKAGSLDWKIKHYASNLKDGDTIYESAMGIGLNVFLTLEAVQEVKEVKNLRVYGNEHIAESVYLASKLLPALLPQVNASVGTICQGDSSDLRSFVPEESMDLVFCGYISTLINPLMLEAGDQEELDDRYEYICNSTNEDWEAEKLAEVAQARQNDWFGNWITEMIRIAKPGAAVIAEQVSLPFCNDPDDWGGVSPAFWKAGIDLYGWDIDPLSIEMETDKVFGQRYHVFMRKNSR